MLIVGSGGREHAIADALSRSPRAPRLLSYAGNPGIHQLAPALQAENSSPGSIVAAARDAEVDLVVVGPEVFLEAGLVDACKAAGLAAFGPSRAAARIETSKSWAKQVMQEAGVRSASYKLITEAPVLRTHLAEQPGPYVVKADGIAAGKGVLVTAEREEALAFGLEYLEQSSAVVVEERLEGPEVSLFAFVSGEDVLPLGCARDYKRAHDGDAGPNTGGMGAISPPDLPAHFLSETVDTIIRPVTHQMKEAGNPFHGMLYAGLILTERGPYVLEFNARFGDPETQVLLPRLRSDLLSVLEAVATGDLSGELLEVREQHACGVTIASEGYPGRSPLRPVPVQIGPIPGGAMLYHAGTSYSSKGPHQLTATGGRVFTAVGLGVTPDEARELAYECARQVEFAGAWYRSDIGA